MTTMYELVTMRDALMAFVVEQDGEILPDQETAWDAVEEKFETKVENTALFIIDLQGDAEKIKAEEQRLAARRKAIENSVERLKNLLHVRLEQFGKTSVKGTLKTVALRPAQSVQEVVPSDQVDMRNIATIAPSMVRHTPERWDWDKNAIKDAAKKGELPIDVAKRVAVVTTYSIQIR